MMMMSKEATTHKTFDPTATTPTEARVADAEHCLAHSDANQGDESESAVTPISKEIRDRRVRMGYCLECEGAPVKLFDISPTRTNKFNLLYSSTKVVPRTVPGVCFEGQCLRCHPEFDPQDGANRSPRQKRAEAAASAARAIPQRSAELSAQVRREAQHVEASRRRAAAEEQTDQGILSAAVARATMITKPKTVAAQRIKRGECPTCGTRTHLKKGVVLQKKQPLTIEGVVQKGICLKCHPMEAYVAQEQEPATPVPPDKRHPTSQGNEPDEKEMAECMKTNHEHKGQTSEESNKQDDETLPTGNIINMPPLRDPGADDDDENVARTPREMDVMCGTDSDIHNHPGNQMYRQQVLALQKAQNASSLEAETNKRNLAKSIVAAVQELGGRFLERDPKTELWHDIGEERALEKTMSELGNNSPADSCTGGHPKPFDQQDDESVPSLHPLREQAEFRFTEKDVLDNGRAHQELRGKVPLRENVTDIRDGNEALGAPLGNPRRELLPPRTRLGGVPSELVVDLNEIPEVPLTEQVTIGSEADYVPDDVWMSMMAVPAALLASDSEASSQNEENCYDGLRVWSIVEEEVSAAGYAATQNVSKIPPRPPPTKEAPASLPPRDACVSLPPGAVRQTISAVAETERGTVAAAAVTTAVLDESGKDEEKYRKEEGDDNFDVNAPLTQAAAAAGGYTDRPNNKPMMKSSRTLPRERNLDQQGILPGLSKKANNFGMESMGVAVPAPLLALDDETSSQSENECYGLRVWSIVEEEGEEADYGQNVFKIPLRPPPTKEAPALAPRKALEKINAPAPLEHLATPALAKTELAAGGAVAGGTIVQDAVKESGEDEEEYKMEEGDDTFDGNAPLTHPPQSAADLVQAAVTAGGYPDCLVGRPMMEISSTLPRERVLNLQNTVPGISARKQFGPRLGDVPPVLIVDPSEVPLVPLTEQITIGSAEDHATDYDPTGMTVDSSSYGESRSPTSPFWTPMENEESTRE